MIFYCFFDLKSPKKEEIFIPQVLHFLSIFLSFFSYLDFVAHFSINSSYIFLVLWFLCLIYLCSSKNQESYCNSLYKKKIIIGVVTLNCYYFYFMYRKNYYNISNRSSFRFLKTQRSIISILLVFEPKFHRLSYLPTSKILFSHFCVLFVLLLRLLFWSS